MFARLTAIAAAATMMLALAAVSAGAATVNNGNFESGTLAGWDVTTTPTSAGNFTTYSGSTLPISNETGEAALGNFSAVADEGGPSSTVLHQDVALETGFSHALTFKYWFKTNTPVWAIPDPLSYLHTTPNNQQIVVDVIKGGTDPFSTDPTVVLGRVFASQVSSPLSSPWTTATLDLSAFAGQTVRLRFLNTGNSGFLFLGVDDVAINSVDIIAPALTGLVASPSEYRFKSKGTIFRYSSTEPATASATISRLTKGKRSGMKCVKPTKKLALKKNCTRTRALSPKLTQQAVTGLNSLVFKGKLGGKRLPVGRYSVSITLTDATGNVSAAGSKKFTVLPPKKKK